MCRHGIGTEGVQEQEIEIRVSHAFELQPPVANHDIAIGSAVQKKCEEMPGEGFYRWIDFEKCHLVRRVRIRRHRSCAEPETPKRCGLFRARRASTTSLTEPPG